MTTVVAAMSVSLHSAVISQSKGLATKYTQEGIEYFRAQKNLMGWETFWETIQAGGSSSTYCLAELPYTPNGGLESVPNRACLSTEFVDNTTVYQREAEVTLGPVNGEDTVTVTVVTTWPDGGQTAQSMATVQFQQSEN